MNENTLKWIQKLESGEYTQTTTYLRHKDSFCCLGVMCDIYDSSAWQKDGDEAYVYNFTEWNEEDEEFIDLPPPSIAEKYIPAGLNMDTLADLNDKGYSFTEIAKIIRHFMEIYHKENTLNWPRYADYIFCSVHPEFTVSKGW